MKFTERAQDEASRELLDRSSEQEKLVQKVKMSHEHLWRASGVTAVLVVPGEVTASTAGNPTCGDEGSKMEVMVKTKEVAKAARLVRRPLTVWNTENKWRTDPVRSVFVIRVETISCRSFYTVSRSKMQRPWQQQQTWRS